MAVVKRLEKEWKLWEADPVHNCSISKLQNDKKQWYGQMFGPIGTPYAGFRFSFEIHFPETYPLKEMRFRFVRSPLLHPDIDSRGRLLPNAMRPRVLGDSWSPAFTVKTLLMSVSSLLGSSNREAAEHYGHCPPVGIDGSWPERPYWYPGKFELEVIALSRDFSLFQRVASGFCLLRECRGHWQPSMHHLWPRDSKERMFLVVLIMQSFRFRSDLVRYVLLPLIAAEAWSDFMCWKGSLMLSGLELFQDNSIH